MNIDINEFYDRIKYLLKKNHKSLDDLMSIKGLSFNAKSTYFSMRKAGNVPRADDVLRIARFFNVSMEYLITGNEPDNNPIVDDTRKHLHEALKNLDKL